MSTSAPSREADDIGVVDFERLDRYMARALTGKDDCPISRAQLSGGLSQMTVVYRSDAPEAAGSLVVRIPPLSGPLEPYVPAVEARLLTAVAEHGIAAPEVELIEESGDVIGRPFYVTRFLESAAMSAEGTFGPGADRDAMARAYVDQLAAIHQVPLDVATADGTTVSGLLEIVPDKAPRSVLDRWSDALDKRNVRVPAYQSLLRSWLEVRVPEDRGARALVHGDYRLANLLWTQESTIAATMDWEEAGVGDPYLDLAWTLLGSSADHDMIFGLASRRWVLDRYAERTGAAIDEHRLLWWEVAAGWMLLCMNALAAVFAAEPPSRDIRPLLFCYFNRRIAVGYLQKIQAYERTLS